MKRWRSARKRKHKDTLPELVEVPPSSTDDSTEESEESEMSEDESEKSDKDLSGDENVLHGPCNIRPIDTYENTRSVSCI